MVVFVYAIGLPWLLLCNRVAMVVVVYAIGLPWYLLLLLEMHGRGLSASWLLLCMREGCPHDDCCCCLECMGEVCRMVVFLARLKLEFVCLLVIFLARLELEMMCLCACWLFFSPDWSLK